MPYYEYQCPHGYERVMAARMDDDRPEEFEAPCEEQEQCTFRRVYSSFGGRFGDTPIHHK